MPVCQVCEKPLTAPADVSIRRCQTHSYRPHTAPSCKAGFCAERSKTW